MQVVKNDGSKGNDVTGQDGLLLVKKQVQDKEALLKDATTKKARLQNIISSFRQALIELRTTLWNNINREIKKSERIFDLAR